jgi:hypothetical protein
VRNLTTWFQLGVIRDAIEPGFDGLFLSDRRGFLGSLHRVFEPAPTKARSRNTVTEMIRKRGVPSAKQSTRNGVARPHDEAGLRLFGSTLR